METPPRDMRSLYVVVVDDDELVCRLATRVLADVGCRVSEAHSGAEALALLAGTVSVDLVVSDIAMPGMTGEELAPKSPTGGLPCRFS